MNWNDIKIFTVVGETGSFSAAAKQLKMDHSSISRRMRQLEKQHNLKLFEREGTRVKLSLAAYHLLESAQHATQHVNQFERALKANVDDLSGRLGFSTLYATERAIMKALAHFSKQYPNIELDIKLSQTLEDLCNNNTDVVLRATNDPAPHFIGRRVATNQFAVYANREYFSATDNLNDVPWVLWSNEFTKPWMKTHYPNAHCACKVNTSEGILEAITSGMGVGHISHLAAVNDSRLIELHPADPTLNIDFWLLYHQDLRASPKVKLFVDFLSIELKKRWRIEH